MQRLPLREGGKRKRAGRGGSLFTRGYSTCTQGEYSTFLSRRNVLYLGTYCDVPCCLQVTERGGAQRWGGVSQHLSFIYIYILGSCCSFRCCWISEGFSDGLQRYLSLPKSFTYLSYHKDYSQYPTPHSIFFPGSGNETPVPFSYLESWCFLLALTPIPPKKQFLKPA